MQRNSRKIKHQGMFICKAGDTDPMAISCYNGLISALLNECGSNGPIFVVCGQKPGILYFVIHLGGGAFIY